MNDWQKYVLECFPKEDFKNIDFSKYDEKGVAALLRFGTYDDFVLDTLQRCGAIAATSLSLLIKPKIIVEMGVQVGWTSLLLSKLNPTAEVYGVDVAEYIHNSPIPTGFVVGYHGVKNHKLHIMNSWEFDMEGKVDLCFIDADHFLPAVQMDTERAWENRNVNGNWCIAWDDYHENNPDVFNTVNEFVKKVGYPLQKIASWFYISNLTISENDLANKKWY